MRIHEILTEQQLNEMHLLQEGPLGSLVRAAGRGVGNVIGGVAKGIGAVKGAVSGAVDRAKTGFAAGQKGAYDAVAGKPAAAGATGNPVPQTQTLANPKSPASAGGTTPPAGAATPPAGAATPPAGAATPPAGAATPPAGAATPPAGAATPPAGAATPPAGAATPPADAPADAAPDEPKAAAEPQSDSEYDKAQKAIEALPPEQKKEIIGLLQADPKVKAAMAEPPPPQDEKSAGDAAGAGAAAFGNMAKTLTQEPAAKVPKKTGGASRVPKKPAPTPTASAQADVGKPGFLQNKIKGSQVTASLVHRGKSLNEVFAQRLSMHKQKMFETGIARGTTSIFRK